ncbi:TetR/AcrR family transcriptional regulator, partial [Rhodococcus pyridinivorans]|nr:TetR/AcrR family transcriptional regulator [Rhodococcus pyridinivorans]
RNTLWRTFSGPSTALFADGDGSDVEIDAKAVLVMAAGSALFAGLIAAEDDTPALRARILELLSTVA